MMKPLLWLSSRPPRLWFWLAALLLVALYGASIYVNQSEFIDGQRVFWLQDDMMISLRYASSLAHGGGLVWNPGGEHVEGYSNLAWVLVMALPHWLSIPNSLTSLFVLIVNLALALVVLALTSRLMLRLMPDPGLALPAALVALVLSFDLGRWTTTGMETPLLTVGFLWLTLRILHEAESGLPRAGTFVALGLLGVIRADGMLYSGCLGLAALALSPARRRVLLLAPLALIFPLAQVGFRLAYYGYPLPNTFYLKVTGWGLAERFWPGVRYVLYFLLDYGVLWLAAAVYAWRSRQRRVIVLWAMGLPLMAFAVYVGGDDFAGARFFAPWLPILTALAFLAPAILYRRLAAGWQISGVGLLTVLAVLFSHYNFFAGPGAELDFVRLGLYLNRATRSDTVIGHIWAGAAPYFAVRPAVDLLGKNDAVVAHGVANPGSLKPGHNKFDFAYSLGELRPDLIVHTLHPGSLAVAEDVQRFAQGSDAYLGRLYLERLFQEHYAAQFFLIGSLPVFIRDDSAELARLMVGRCENVENPARGSLGMRRVCWPQETPR